MNSWGTVPAAQALPLVLTECASLGGAHFFFDFLLLAIISLHTFQEAVLALPVLNMLNTYINSLGKNLALVCLQECQLHAG